MNSNSWNDRTICEAGFHAIARGPGLWMLAAQPFFVLGTAYLMEATNSPHWSHESDFKG